MSNKSNSTLWRILLIVIIMLLAATLACDSGTTADDDSGDDDAAVEPSATPRPTDPPEPSATPLPPVEEPEEEPVEEPEKEPVEEPEEEPAEEAEDDARPLEPTSGISADNAGDIKTIFTTQAEHSALTGVAYSQTENLVATFGWAKTIKLWDIDEREQDGLLKGATEWGMAVEFSPDGSKLVAGSTYSYRYYVWDLETTKMLYQMVTNSWVRRTRWSPDGESILIAGSGPSECQIYESNSGQLSMSLFMPGGGDSAAYSPDGEYAACGDGNGNITIFSAEDGSTVNELPFQFNKSVPDMEFSPDSELLAAGYDNGSIVIFSAEESGKPIQTLNYSGGSLMDLDFGKGSDIIFAAYEDGKLVIWNVESGAQLFTENYHIPVWSVSVSGDGKNVALAIDDGKLIVLGLPD